MTREFKYYPEDFGELTVDVQHYDLHFDVFEDHTKVTSTLHVQTKEHIDKLVLNARDLDILSLQCEEQQVTYVYDTEKHLVTINLKEAVPKGQKLTFQTVSICKPTKNVLEGMYYDETPKGCPCTMITQCQQWGFQRIVPCIDDMTAKCTYHTTIIADERYTNLITNGDPEIPITPVEEGRVKITYDNSVTPMATYLFFLGVGTYATFTKEFVYPDGASFMLELLVPPDSDKDVAQQALDIMHDAIMWIHLFTGPDTHQNKEAAQQAWNLLQETKRDEAHEVLKDLRLGYKYTGKVYREIGMQNSDFGGMENVGNTTIVTNRIMPYPYMGDNAFIYMMRVKAHEYYHNLNGSEVTGHSPFEIWLNEAVTVFIEQQYAAFYYGDDFMRLREVHGIIAPHGTLDQDASPASMSIEPEGFNDPNELISGITYVKAPELVRMIETIMGKDNFTQALHNYHTKYKHSNAKWQQWVDEMSELAPFNLTRMADMWLRQTNFPTVTIDVRESDDAFIIYGVQTEYQEDKFWEFPITYALFDTSNTKTHEATYVVREKEFSFEVPKTDVGFWSWNRSLSFYGRVSFASTKQQLLAQARCDDDVVNRSMAIHELFKSERLAMLQDPTKELDSELRDLYFEVLSNKELGKTIGVELLAVFEDVDDERYKHDYEALYQVSKRIKLSIAQKYKKELLELYNYYTELTGNSTQLHARIQSVKLRQVKNTCLGLLSYVADDTILDAIREQLSTSVNATDRISAFIMYLRTDASDKQVVVEDQYKYAKGNLVTWETFLQAIASNGHDDCLSHIKWVESLPEFRIEQSSDHRGLLVVFAGNRRKSLMTQDGREYLTEKITQMASVNEYGCNHMIEDFAGLEFLPDPHRLACTKVLAEVYASIDKEKSPSVASHISRLLKGTPKAVDEFTQTVGHPPI